ncbi:hypothetical protein H6A18_09465 [Collinsella tanakaei]|uniref:hypothetical protein n=1 Tax=Collinsella tanakaei TaxID=626935 RepID=UPI0019574E34|nr:hypothetical protein [Collinsella tanakaei]MBM6756729.1 hypothetical protein [Collinsella tanakaei]
MIIDVKPATTLAEAADQMEEAIGMCEDHYVRVCDVVLSNWSMLCRSVDVDALLALAEEMDRVADENRLTGMMAIGRARAWAGRIREALGASE